MAGLYVHVPFCHSRCGYCAFASSVYDPVRAGRYLAALEREAATAVSAAAGGFETVYLGGGTPTALALPELLRLLEIIRATGALAAPAELTVEANPGTLDAEKASLLRAAGFNRISLGAQSFADDELALLGRLHGAADIAAAVIIARRAGFQSLGLDLIFGLPAQSPESFSRSLEAALALSPEHVSLYGLTYEPGTPLAAALASGRLSRCPEEAEREMLLGAVERLTHEGFEHYEVANFARPGHRSRHNLNYWQGGDYVGLGAGAFSFTGGERRGNVGDVEEYCARIETGRSPVETRERLSGEKRAREALMLALRMVEGVDLAEFKARTGFDAVALFGDSLQGHVGAQRLLLDSGRLRFTIEGLLVSNSVLAEFI